MNYLEELKYYCQQEITTGALLLTGKWGSGKTYFIDNEFIDDSEIKEKYLVIKISLFGISTVSEFNTIVKQKVIMGTNSFVGKVLSGKRSSKALKIINILKKANPYADAVFSIDWATFYDVDKYCEVKDETGAESGKKEKELILVFDDLERCDIKPIILFGLLNEYIEEKKIKTIILANEEYAIKKEESSNDEVKTKVDNIKNIYSEMKEKIISRSFNFKNDIEKVVNNIIESYEKSETKKEYYAFLNNNTSMVINVLKESKCGNIRSLICGVQQFERIFEYFMSKTDIENDNVCKKTLYNFLAITFAFRQDDFNYTEKGKFSFETYGQFNISMKEKYSLLNQECCFLAIVKWICEGVWDEELLEIEISTYLNKHKKIEPGDHLLLCDNIIYVDDEILKNGWESYMEKIYSGKYHIRHYKTFLRLIGSFEFWKIPLPEEIDYKRVNEGIDKCFKNILTSKDVYKVVMVLKEDIKEYLNSEEIKIADKIINFDNTVYCKKNYIDLKEAFDRKNYDDINNIISSKRITFDKALGESFVSLYNDSSNFDKQSLSDLIINKVKNTDTETKDEIDFFEAIIGGITDNDSDKVITKRIEELFIDKINAKIEQLKNYY